MDATLVAFYCVIVVIATFIVFSIFMCGFGQNKKNIFSKQCEEISSFEAGVPSAGTESPSFVSTNEAIDLNAKRSNARAFGGGSIVGIPKLPPKGEEVDVPLPKAAQGKQFKKGPRPKRVPKAGHTCPVAPADEDPTMPVEDDMQAYKMAAKNKPAAPIPPVPAYRLSFPVLWQK